MTKTEELLSHAARCDRLAQSCSDAGVATKLRQLADDYRELADQRLAWIQAVESRQPRVD
jgi:hypothetical protein